MKYVVGGRIEPRDFPWPLAGALSVLALELSIVLPWSRLLVFPAGGWPLPVLLLCLLLFAWLARSLTMLVEGSSVPAAVSMAAATVCLVLGLLLTINLYTGGRPILDVSGAARAFLGAVTRGRLLLSEVPLVLVVAFAWRRGAAAASPTILEAKRTGFKFRLGIILYAAFVLVVGQDGGSPIPEMLPAFFLASLLAMSLARAHWYSREPGVGEIPFSGEWLMALLLLFLLTLALGLLSGLGLASETAYRALDGLRRGILLLLYLLLVPLVMLLSPLLNRLGSLVERWIASTEQPRTFQLEPDFRGVFGGPSPFLETLERWADAIRPYLPTMWVFLVAAAALAVILWGAGVVRRRRAVGWGPPGVEDRGESLAEPSPLGALRRVMGAFGREFGSWRQAVLAGQLRTALIVRRVYGQLLALGAERGRPRRRWQTPHEYQTTLAEILPSARQQVAVLTAAYVQVRYGELQETEDLVQQVRSAWTSLQTELG